jgi:hypothetical protein
VPFTEYFVYEGDIRFQVSYGPICVDSIAASTMYPVSSALSGFAHDLKSGVPEIENGFGKPHSAAFVCRNISDASNRKLSQSGLKKLVHD